MVIPPPDIIRFCYSLTKKSLLINYFYCSTINEIKVIKLTEIFHELPAY